MAIPHHLQPTRKEPVKSQTIFKKTGKKQRSGSPERIKRLLDMKNLRRVEMEY